MVWRGPQEQRTAPTPLVLVTGGSGMVGRNIVRRLRDEGYRVRVFARRPDRLDLPEVERVPGDVQDPERLRPAMAGATAVVHTVAVIREGPGATYTGVNVLGTRNVLRAAQEAGIRRFVHIGGVLSSTDPRYRYGYSKWLAEQAVQASALDWTILKPGMIIGDRPSILNRIERTLYLLPPLVALPGTGSSRCQPLWVGDLTAIVVQCLREPRHIRRIYEFGGPEYWTYRQLLEFIMRRQGVRRILVPVPQPLMLLGARLLAALSRDPQVTPVEMQQLFMDNIAARDAVERYFGFRPGRLEDHCPEIRGGYERTPVSHAH
ncbi:MAG: NAD(P)H-binding protein [Chloroflexi bacterium]|nr:NAD(P)H-binding protein [Chloroflexota bacterium]